MWFNIRQRILAQSKLEDQHDVSAFVSERIVMITAYYWQDRQLWRSYSRMTQNHSVNRTHASTDERTG